MLDILLVATTLDNLLVQTMLDNLLVQTKLDMVLDLYLVGKLFVHVL